MQFNLIKNQICRNNVHLEDLGVQNPALLFNLASVIKNYNMSAVYEAVASSPITLTDGAVKELKNIMENEKIPSDHGLRVGVKGGGCSGFSYILGFDVRKENDQVYLENGITILMEKAHGLYLVGMEIDYHDGLDNRGFLFNNPNASDTCGCGSSFSA